MNLGPERSNCLIVALCLFFRRGGYLVIRPSRLGRWLPHVMWARDITGLQVWEYKPPRGLVPLRLFGFTPVGLFFRGRMRHGKGEEIDP